MNGISDYLNKSLTVFPNFFLFIKVYFFKYYLQAKDSTDAVLYYMKHTNYEMICMRYLLSDTFTEIVYENRDVRQL